MLILLSEAHVLISDPATGSWLIKMEKEVSPNIVPLVKKTLQTHGTAGRGRKIMRSLLVQSWELLVPLTGSSQASW